MWSSLANSKGTLRGSLRWAGCGNYSKPCVEYSIEVVGYHLPGLSPTKLTVTNVDQRKVILVDRSIYGFLYMAPVEPGGNLMATVWGTGTGYRGVKVYRLRPDSASVVFDKWSNFTPQIIEANGSTPNPAILLDQGREVRGSEVVPTETRIWLWNSPSEKFVLRATVPAGQKLDALAKLEHGAKNQ